MLMVDSNVIIDFWRKPTEKLKRIFCSYECCICGVQMAELLYGAVSEKDADAIERALSDFTMIQMGDSDWSLLGRFLYRLRKKGVTVPIQDAMIASVAMKHGLPVWTHDRHFRHIQSVFPELRLFDEETSED